MPRLIDWLPQKIRVPNIPWNQTGKSLPFPNVTPIYLIFQNPVENCFLRFIPLLHLHFLTQANFFHLFMYTLLIFTFHVFVWAIETFFLVVFVSVNFYWKTFSRATKIFAEKRRKSRDKFAQQNPCDVTIDVFLFLTECGAVCSLQSVPTFTFYPRVGISPVYSVWRRNRWDSSCLDSQKKPLPPLLNFRKTEKSKSGRDENGSKRNTRWCGDIPRKALNTSTWRHLLSLALFKLHIRVFFWLGNGRRCWRQKIPQNKSTETRSEAMILVE